MHITKRRAIAALLVSSLFACGGSSPSAAGSGADGAGPGANGSGGGGADFGGGGDVPGTPSSPDGGVAANGANDGGAANADGGDAGAGCDVTRLAGANRFDTAARISQARYAANGVAVLTAAVPEGNPDLVTASSLAAMLGAPLLYGDASSGTVPQETGAEMTRLGVTTVYAVTGNGGSWSLASALGQLPAFGVTRVQQVSGADRYATAAAAASTARPSGAEAIIVSGLSNHLVDGAGAGAFGLPVLLVDGSSTIPSATSSALADLGVRDTIALGGTAAVSDAELSDLAAAGQPATRLAGADRYATSIAVASAAAGRAGATFDTVFVASGDETTPTDAAAAGATRQLVVESPASALPDGATQLITTTRGVRHVVLVGGTAALSDAVLASAQAVCP